MYARTLITKCYPLVCVVFLASCTPLDLLKGGPSINTNANVGKEVTQQAVANQTTNKVGRDMVTQSTPVVADQIKEVNIQQTPISMIALLVLGWLLPSPNEIARWIKGALAPLRRGLFKR